MTESIHARIDLLRRRVHGAELARTSGRLLATVVCGLAVWLAADRWLVTTLFGTGWWDLGARIILNATLVWLIVGEARRGLVNELRRVRSDDELAMRLEHAHPHLAGRWISTVQLMRDLRTGEQAKVGSPELVEALAAEAEAEADTVDHRAAWDSAPARKIALVGVALLIVALGLAVWRHEVTSAFLRRLVLLAAHYPTATRITAVHVPDRVGRGDPLTIEVEVDPGSTVPALAEARLRDHDGRGSTLRLERVVSTTGQVRFRGVLTQAVDDLTIQLRAGDHRWETVQTVRVVSRPVLSELHLRLVYPAYLGMPPAETTVGDLEAPVGTTVEVRARASRAVTTARLGLTLGEEVVATTTDLAIAGDGTGMQGSFTVTGAGSWSISLGDAEGLGVDDPPHWTLTAVPDRAPVITATFPARDLDVTRQARWPVRYLASDDHGLAGIRLCWLVVPPGGDPTAPAAAPATTQAIPKSVTKGPEQIQGEVLFDLNPLQLDPGARVLWWFEAEDNRTPEPTVTATQRGTFTIIDAAEMRDRMLRERTELTDSVPGLLDREREALGGVDTIRKALKP